jgi:hypothetical protein
MVEIPMNGLNCTVKLQGPFYNDFLCRLVKGLDSVVTEPSKCSESLSVIPRRSFMWK